MQSSQFSPIQALQVLAARLGRRPTFLELLRELGGPQAGEAVSGVGDPGYPAVPSSPSLLLGSVESDEGLSARLEAASLAEANPELLRLREELVKSLLFGPLAGSGGSSDQFPWFLQRGGDRSLTLGGPGGRVMGGPSLP